MLDPSLDHGVEGLELWLVRHGETAWNREGRVQGYGHAGDPALSEHGQMQARRLAPRLARTTFSAVYSSDSRRTLQTAQLALPGVKVRLEARLRELGFGAWEGKMWVDVAKTDPDALKRWYENPYQHAPTGGEPYAELKARIQTWLSTLPKTGRVLAFTHGGPVRAALYGLTGVPDAQWRFEVGPASVSKLVLGDAGVIIKTVGDAAHLETEELDAPPGPVKPRPPRARFILVTGGVRSGKSRYAEALVTQLAPDDNALYLATLSAGDDEMARRIAAHRARRPKSWTTLETPLSPSSTVRESSEKVILLDCLSGLVSNVLLEHETEDEEAVIQQVLDTVGDLIMAVQKSRKTVVIVTNEVGSGVVPAYPLGRLYRDALGLANARVARAADAVALCVAGLPQVLKGMLPEVLLDA